MRIMLVIIAIVAAMCAAEARPKKTVAAPVSPPLASLQVSTLAGITMKLTKARGQFQRTADAKAYRDTLLELLAENRRLLEDQLAPFFKKVVVENAIRADGGPVSKEDMQYRFDAARRLEMMDGGASITHQLIRKICEKLSLIYTFQDNDAKAEEYRECAVEN